QRKLPKRSPRRLRTPTLTRKRNPNRKKISTPWKPPRMPTTNCKPRRKPRKPKSKAKPTAPDRTRWRWPWANEPPRLRSCPTWNPEWNKKNNLVRKNPPRTKKHLNKSLQRRPCRLAWEAKTRRPKKTSPFFQNGFDAANLD